ncbi:succinate dehydrogenase assembly factor 2 [Dissophora globulifera]|nr:succinate dehydrogenase assembly factor 2 [Dissophora globulifera]
MSPSSLLLRASLRTSTTAIIARTRSPYVGTASTAVALTSCWSRRALSSKSSPPQVLDHDDARDNIDPDGFQTPYTNLPPLPRDPDESLETIRARLTYQSRKRGILETDLLLSTFSKEFLSKMSLEECRTYDKLMDEPDWDIYYWVTGKKEVPERWQGNRVFEMIVRHAKNEGRVVRQMPAL